MSLLRNSSDTQLHVADFPNYSKPLNVAGTHFSGTHMPGITKQSLRRASITPSAQPAASAELCSFPLLNIHCAQMQYILNIKQELLRAGISIPRQSCWLFGERRAASCGERDSIAAPPPAREVVQGRRAGSLAAATLHAAQEMRGHTAPSTNPAAQCCSWDSTAAQPSSRATKAALQNCWLCIF